MKRCCAYISIPDPAYEHRKIVHCSRFGEPRYVTEKYCDQCDFFTDIADAIDNVLGGLNHEH